MGRSSLIMVLGFSMALMLKGYNLSSVSEEAYTNVISYYTRAQAHSLAASIANMGSNAIYLVPNSFPSRSEFSMGGGRVKISVFVCPVPPYDSGKVGLLATSYYPYPLSTDPKKNYYDTVYIVWGQSRFSKFAYYSANEGPSGNKINWATKDTVFGPFHTQDKMTINGSPVFWGKVTNKLGMTTGQTPEFHAGYQTGIDIPMPSDYNPLINAAKTNGRYLHGKDLTISFDTSGHMNIKPWPGRTDTTVLITTFAPNGAIVVDSANVHVKGKFTGQLTLAVRAGGHGGRGNLWLDSSIAYKTNPLVNPASTDLLGLVAEDTIFIKNNSNNDPDITIQAALFSQYGGLFAEDYAGSLHGRINLLGGVSQAKRAAVGQLSGGVVVSGYSKSYKYDTRMMVTSPPYYPATGSYEILSWYER